MMTDAERQTMRDSVCGMPLEQAAALPIFDDVRGTVTSGMPAERYFAITYGAVVGARQQTADEAKADAAYDQMVKDLNVGHRAAPDAPSLPEFASDGRPMAQLADYERAREEMIHSQSSAWKGAIYYR
jgi:hypothetical protein